MKTSIKSSLLLAMIFGLTMNLTAQNFKYGLTAGSNFSVQSETGDLYNNDEIKQGWHAGIFGNYYINKIFSLQAELNYDQKGSESEKFRKNYEYITTPLLAKWSLGKSKNMPLKFNLFAGPYLGFLVSAESEPKNAETAHSLDIKRDTENTEFGVLGGLGIAYPLNSGSILLDFRIGLGLNNFDKSDNKQRNKYFGINFGYEF